MKTDKLVRFTIKSSPINWATIAATHEAASPDLPRYLSKSEASEHYLLGESKFFAPSNNSRFTSKNFKPFGKSFAFKPKDQHGR